MNEEAKKMSIDGAKDFAEHIERLTANVLTKDTLAHFTKAATEMVKAMNVTIDEVKIPDEAKEHLLRAEKETILAMRDFLDAVLKEIGRLEEKKKKKGKDLKKIEIED